MDEMDDDDLLAALGVTIEPKKTAGRTPQEERIIAGFEDIVRFFKENGRIPQHGDERDIFERLYAVRLDRLRTLEDCRALLAPLDHHRLLNGKAAPAAADDLDDDQLLAELGLETPQPDDITQLRHIKSRSELRAAEEIANRTRCEDFDQFKPLFARIKKELENATRETRRFGQDASIQQGEFFILGGQTVYVAALGDEIVTDYDRPDRRLRVIYDNGTESNILLRSLQRALYKDETGRRITNPSAGPLFGGASEQDDLASGTIYVLRSKSDHPEIAAHRDLIHKIGVTGGKVESRIAIAALDPTYLLAAVEIVATYQLFNINRTKLEKLIHRVFAAAQLDLTIPDRFGNPVKPKEWFLVPLSVIDQVVDKIRDGSIVGFEYDPAQAMLRKTN